MTTPVVCNNCGGGFYIHTEYHSVLPNHPDAELPHQPCESSGTSEWRHLRPGETFVSVYGSEDESEKRYTRPEGMTPHLRQEMTRERFAAIDTHARADLFERVPGKIELIQDRRDLTRFIKVKLGSLIRRGVMDCPCVEVIGGKTGQGECEWCIEARAALAVIGG